MGKTDFYELHEDFGDFDGISEIIGFVMDFKVDFWASD